MTPRRDQRNGADSYELCTGEFVELAEQPKRTVNGLWWQFILVGAAPLNVAEQCDDLICRRPSGIDESQGLGHTSGNVHSFRGSAKNPCDSLRHASHRPPDLTGTFDAVLTTAFSGHPVVVQQLM